MPYMETGEKAAFVIGGLVETVLLVASMLGYVLWLRFNADQEV